MNKEELLNAFKECPTYADDFETLLSEGLWFSDDESEMLPLEKHLKQHGIELKEKASFGGEGQGETYWTVFSCTKDGVTTFFKIDGWYASYEGGHYDDPLDFYEVELKEVKVKKWLPK